jgi:hypothetical protein
MFGFERAKRYWGGVYEFEGYDHYSLVRRDMFGNLAPRIKIVWLYVGQTRQRGFEGRWAEHEFGSKHWDAEPKEWWDLVWRKHKAIAKPGLTQTKLNGLEDKRMKYRLPQYNVKGNQNNPNRIKPGKDHEVWKAQRAERDALGGTAYLVKLAKARERQGRWPWRLFAPKTVGHIQLAGDEATGDWTVTGARGDALEGFPTAEALLISRIEEARR